MSAALPVPVFTVLTAVEHRFTLVTGQHAFGDEGRFKAAGFADQFTFRGSCFCSIRAADVTDALHAGTTIEAHVVIVVVTAAVVVIVVAAATALLLLLDVMAAAPPMML